MTKKAYVKPTITIVKLHQRTQLLVGSNISSVSAGRASYGEAEVDDWK